MKKDKSKNESSASDREAVLAARLKTLGISRNKVAVLETDFKPTDFISTGILEIDTVIGCDGIPKGTLIELCGESQSGKTYASLKFIASACSKGERCAFMNVENSFYDERAKSVGVPRSL